MRCLFFIALASLFSRAQTPPASTFAVASLVRNNSAERGNAEMKVLAGGKVVIRNVTLLMIVAAAWDVPFQSPRLTGGKDWEEIREQRFDIDATPEPGAIPAGISAKERGALLRPMMQALLADRFQLRMRRDPKDQPVYALTIANGGPALQVSKAQEKECGEAPPDAPKVCFQIGGGQERGINGEAVSIDDVVLFVQNWTDRPIIDKTGLTDLYTIHTEGWAPMRRGRPTPGRTIADVFRQLGLAMESERAVVDMFVIEHISSPAAN